ncbi:hypothetical protein S83_057210 [Arachis hypogaea]
MELEQILKLILILDDLFKITVVLIDSIFVGFTFVAAVSPDNSVFGSKCQATVKTVVSAILFTAVSFLFLSFCAVASKSMRRSLTYYSEMNRIPASVIYIQLSFIVILGFFYFGHRVALIDSIFVGFTFAAAVSPDDSVFDSKCQATVKTVIRLGLISSSNDPPLLVVLTGFILVLSILSHFGANFVYYIS